MSILIFLKLLRKFFHILYVLNFLSLLLIEFVLRFPLFLKKIFLYTSIILLFKLIFCSSFIIKRFSCSSKTLFIESILYYGLLDKILLTYFSILNKL